MTCNNNCEIVEWNVSNSYLVKEVMSPNVSIDDIKLLAMATKQIVKENTGRKAIGCASGCECVQVGESQRVWGGDIYKKTIGVNSSFPTIEIKINIKTFLKEARSKANYLPISI
ncbi:MAG: hypothetical protein JRI63_05765 [Deltaproteobacteria bacterium]|nr:hypothetical protein [Deltaproteobacteria bacterium]